MWRRDPLSCTGPRSLHSGIGRPVTTRTGDRPRPHTGHLLPSGPARLDRERSRVGRKSPGRGRAPLAPLPLGLTSSRRCRPLPPPPHQRSGLGRGAVARRQPRRSARRVFTSEPSSCPVLSSHFLAQRHGHFTRVPCARHPARRAALAAVSRRPASQQRADPQERPNREAVWADVCARAACLPTG